MKKIIALIFVCTLFSFIVCKAAPKPTGGLDVAINNYVDTTIAGVAGSAAQKVTDSLSVIHTNYTDTTITTVGGKTVTIITYSDGSIVTNYGDTTIVGMAREDKAGACVVINPDTPCFVRGLFEWPKDVYNKKVKVSGKLVVIDSQALFKIYPYRQGYRLKYLLEDAKWEVVE